MQTNEDSQPSFLRDEQIISSYQVIRRLGRGAMGQVYLAEQIHVGRRLVALKILNQECAANPQLVKRFESEAATAGRIQNRNVVTIYESRMTAQGHLYVAMEYVAGRTLREEIAARGALPLGEVIEIARQICAGLAAAHKLGIVHRDIKPDNIMLVRSAEDGGELTVKVLDFGIARLSESQPLSIHTAPGLIIGTPAYLSPEQAAGAIGNQIDSRADIYSLGMVIYEMITGRVAFHSNSWLAVVRQQLYDPPPTPSQLLQGVKIPAAVEQVVMRALEKDRERRPQSALQFARDLEQAYAQPANPANKPGPPIAHVVVPPHPSQIASHTAVTERSLESNIPVSAASANHTDRRSAAAHKPIPNAAPSQIGRSVRKWKLAAGLSVLVLIVAAVAIWTTTNRENKTAELAPISTVSPSPSPVAPAILQEILTFRVTRRDPVENMLTLPLDLAVRSSERISFEFKLAQPGAIYLFLENGDHSWRWLDASPAGRAAISPSDRWVVLPKDSWYVLDDNIGTEIFWLLHVPRENSWTLAEIIAPDPILVERDGRWDGTAIIRAESVEKISAWLKTNGAELKVSGRQGGKEVLFNLWQESEPDKPSFHPIELRHIK